MCVCLAGLSKWVRQLVQHHDTFSNAMQSLVAFSQGQQKAQVAPVGNQTPHSTASSPNSDFLVIVEGQCVSKAAQPQTLGSCVKLPQHQQDTTPMSVLSHPQLKAEQKEKAGEINESVKTQVLLLQG